MLEQLLRTLEMSDTEVKVYLALAELGKAPAAEVARRVQIPRSTVYTALDGLLKKGMVAVEKSAETSYYLASKPEALQRLVEREKQEFEQRYVEKSSAAAELIPMLSPYFKSQNYSVPKLQFFDGDVNVSSMLYDCCRAWQQSIARYDYTWWGYQDHHFVETYREWLDYYWASMHADEKIKLLSNRSATERNLKNRVQRREIRVLPKQSQFSNTIWILGDYVVTIMTRQKPHYAFLLHDAVFAANQRLLFQLLWNLEFTPPRKA